MSLELYKYAKKQGVKVQLACFDIEKADLLELLEDSNYQKNAFRSRKPVFNFQKCRYCGACAQGCTSQAIQFNRYRPSVYVIEGLCSCCCECIKACSKNGISFKYISCGVVYKSNGNGINLIGARLEESNPSGIPLINELASQLDKDCMVIADCGPGADYYTEAILRKMDVAIVVTESTKTWLADAKALFEQVNSLAVPFAIVINKAENQSTEINEIKKYCADKNVNLLATIGLYNPSPKLNAEGYESYMEPFFAETALLWENLYSSIESQIIN